MVVWNTFENDARVLKEARTLAGRGFDVVVHALHVPGRTRKRETLADGVQVVRVGPLLGNGPAPSGGGRMKSSAQGLGLARAFLKIMGRLTRHVRLAWKMLWLRPDVVHAHDVNTLPTAWLVARLARARLVYDAHEISTSREGYQVFRRLVGRVEGCLMPRAEGTITTTDRRAAFFARAYGIARPLVLQNRPSSQHIPKSDRIRSELRLPHAWPIVLYQGGLQPGRGLDRLVDAALDVPDAYFVFVGDGSMGEALRGQVDRLNLEERVRFIPTVPLDELPAYTASADIGVQPIENTCLNHLTTDSNKLFEYVAAGLPVVASRFPEIRKVVNEFDLGVLIPSDNTAALADAILTLVKDESLRERYARNANRAARVLNWEAQEESLLDLYEAVLAPR
jgi:glycosyltransferase involved in cell wall biosynthesis